MWHLRTEVGPFACPELIWADCCVGLLDRNAPHMLCSRTHKYQALGNLLKMLGEVRARQEQTGMRGRSSMSHLPPPVQYDA